MVLEHKRKHFLGLLVQWGLGSKTGWTVEAQGERHVLVPCTLHFDHKRQIQSIRKENPHLAGTTAARLPAPLSSLKHPPQTGRFLLVTGKDFAHDAPSQCTLVKLLFSVPFFQWFTNGKNRIVCIIGNSSYKSKPRLYFHIKLFISSQVKRCNCISECFS